jgi:hypothetical protein
MEVNVEREWATVRCLQAHRGQSSSEKVLGVCLVDADLQMAAVETKQLIQQHSKDSGELNPTCDAVRTESNTRDKSMPGEG